MSLATILSIDGGGIRGIIPARIIAEIEERTNQPASKLFDLIAGTSTGGILALGLATPKEPGSSEPKYRAEHLIELYRQNGRNIFSRSRLHATVSALGLLGPKYEAAGLEEVLCRYFGEFRLHDILTRVLVTSYNTAGPAPTFFKSWRARKPEAGWTSSIRNRYDYRLREIARATSAAPTFFPPLKLADLASGEPDMCLIDGGVFANNPAMCAWAEVPELFRDVKEFIVISIGTGNDEDKVLYAQASGWGLARWARPLVKTLFDGVSDTVHYQMQQRLGAQLGRKYYRFQGNLGKRTAMDNARDDNLQALLGIAEKIISDQAPVFDDVCRELTSAIADRPGREAA
jgi:patatin-like phospholipase/acyl hydrolase